MLGVGGGIVVTARRRGASYIRSSRPTQRAMTTVSSVAAQKRNRNLLETNRRQTHMTHTRIHHLAVGILAIAAASVIWLALSTTTVPASARTFNFNSAVR
jgi:hypothetical protein